jgi:hypothetical protein
VTTAIFVTQRWRIRNSMKEGPPKIEDKKEFTARYAEQRERILDEFENHTEGINVGRIASFAEENGLEMVPYRLLYKEEIPRLKQVLDNSTMELSDRGNYRVGPDIVFAFRDQVLEELNGCAFTGGWLIHELVHASYSYAVSGLRVARVRRGGLKIGPIRLGAHIEEMPLYFPYRSGGTNIMDPFTLPDEVESPKQSVYSGHYFEEGLAELMRYRYMHGFMDEKQRVALASLNGISPEDVSSALISIKFERGATVDVPLSLLFVREPNDQRIADSTFAGAGLMSLCEHIPELEDALWKARAQPEALREIPKIVNGFYPGLYSKLMKVPYDGEEFAKATKMIEDIVDEKEKANNE